MDGLIDLLGKGLCGLLAMLTAACACALVVCMEIEKYKDEQSEEDGR
ncbi:MAG: hypothetical protein Q4F18_15205 [Clostridia bacterium]|nr:hypothetical protein [Clostridia bacterium]